MDIPVLAITKAEINKLRESGGVGYAEYAEATVVAETEFSEVYEGLANNPIQVGDIVHVICNGTEFVGTAKEHTLGYILVGNGSLLGSSESTGEAYAVVYVPEENHVAAIFDGISSGILSIRVEARTLHVIDENFLPVPPIIKNVTDGTEISLELGNKIKKRALEGKTPCLFQLATHNETGFDTIISIPVYTWVSERVSDNKFVTTIIMKAPGDNNAYNQIVFTFGDTVVNISVSELA